MVLVYTRCNSLLSLKTNDYLVIIMLDGRPGCGTGAEMRNVQWDYRSDDPSHHWRTLYHSSRRKVKGL